MGLFPNLVFTLQKEDQHKKLKTYQKRKTELEIKINKMKMNAALYIQTFAKKKTFPCILATL